VIETLRAGIVGAPLDGSASSAPMTHGVTELAAAARRLALIDPSRAGVGGLRLQLELALFPDVPMPARAIAPQPSAPTSREPVPGAAPDPTPAPTAAPKASPKPSPAATPPIDVVAATSEPEPEPPSKPTPAATPAAASVSAPAATGDLAILRDRWAEIVARISLHPPTKPLIVACRPISVEDGIVTLGFPEDKSFLRAVAERRKAVLEETVSAVLGRSVGVRCVATNLDLVPEMPADAEAAWVLAEARRIFQEDGSDPAEVG
jgi:hypothetical protein